MTMGLGRLLPLVEGRPMGCKGQALAQLIPLSSHQSQLNGEVLHLLIHLPVSEEGRWGWCLPSGACGQVTISELAFGQHSQGAATVLSLSLVLS